MRVQIVSAPLALAGVLLASAGLAACHPKSIKQAKADLAGAGAHISDVETLKGPVTIAARLDCPAEQGEFKRTAAADDGKSCDYASDKGVLQLALMDGVGADPTAALDSIKARIDAMLPRPASGATVQVVSEKGPDGHEVDKVDMPFIHVRDDGTHSHVKILGMTIDADDDHRHKSDAATTSESGAAPKGRQYTYILAGSPQTPDGYHAVGYVARGDGVGKVVVATFKYRRDVSSSRFDEHGHNDMDALLVSRNAPES